MWEYNPPIANEKPAIWGNLYKLRTQQSHVNIESINQIQNSTKSNQNKLQVLLLTLIKSVKNINE